jgi:EAL domain-containing protein (putative c-di-GMP-specific phosphodiesterase class I)
MLAGRAGVAGASFPIDYGIDPATVPRHSFIDIRDGRFDPRAISGKSILIGATAVELGDRYAVPNYGVIPGVVIQALAAETLMRGVPAAVGWPAGLALACLLSCAVLRTRGRASLIALTILTPPALFGAGVALQSATGAVMQLVPALVMLLTAIAGSIGVRIIRRWAEGRQQDPVTGLPNRQALLAILKDSDGAIVLVARIPDYEKLAAGLSAEATGRLILRLVDRIRLVNGEAQVHRINDRMLVWTAAVDHEAVGQQCDTLRTLMLSPVEVDGRRIDLRLSIGMAVGDGSNAGATIANAALASEQARGKQGGWHLHTEAEGEAIDRDLTLLAELNDAVLNGQLEVVYQPKLDIATRRIASVEALVRWQHPTRGYLRPDIFVPLAERSDRIAGMTLAVVERTIGDLATWTAAGHQVTAAINLSAKLLTSTSFIAELTAVLERSGVPAECLTFEVTESAAMSDPDEARAALMRFRDMGIAISMDDYGTGQSTLSYLKQLPLNELKIDRSFVQFAHQNRGDAILVRSTIDLAHELGLKVVAEGVEDEACLAFLASVGCDLAQGYLISRPVGRDEIAAMLGDTFAVAA